MLSAPWRGLTLTPGAASNPIRFYLSLGLGQRFCYVKPLDCTFRLCAVFRCSFRHDLTPEIQNAYGRHHSTDGIIRLLSLPL
jgi:hypothetical protein